MIRQNLVCDFRGVEFRPIEVEIAGHSRRVAIPELLSFEIEGVRRATAAASPITSTIPGIRPTAGWRWPGRRRPRCMLSGSISTSSTTAITAISRRSRGLPESRIPDGWLIPLALPRTSGMCCDVAPRGGTPPQKSPQSCPILALKAGQCRGRRSADFSSNFPARAGGAPCSRIKIPVPLRGNRALPPLSSCRGGRSRTAGPPGSKNSLLPGNSASTPPSASRPLRSAAYEGCERADDLPNRHGPVIMRTRLD